MKKIKSDIFPDDVLSIKASNKHNEVIIGVHETKNGNKTRAKIVIKSEKKLNKLIRYLDKARYVLPEKDSDVQE